MVIPATPPTPGGDGSGWFAADLPPSNIRARRYAERPCDECGAPRRIRLERLARDRGRCTSCAARHAALRTGRRPPTRRQLTPEERRERKRAERRRASERRAAARTWAFVAGWCAGCGEAFVARWASDAGPSVPRYCTAECRQCHRRKGRPRRMIRPAVRLRVFDRDGWTCQLCGDPVDPALVTPHPRSAEVDHVIPKAAEALAEADGVDLDAEWNLQCSHRECNRAKADRVPDGLVAWHTGTATDGLGRVLTPADWREELRR